MNKRKIPLFNDNSSSCEENLFPLVVGEVIMQLRKSMGITGKELAKQLGISQQQVSRYENGVSHMTIEKLYNIIKCLDISIDDFFSYVSYAIAEKRAEYQDNSYFTDYLSTRFINNNEEISKFK